MSSPDIMLLDEPTNHLDTESMEWLECYLKDYPGTILAIAHDRFFLDKIALQIAELAACTFIFIKETIRTIERKGKTARRLEKRDGLAKSAD